MNIRKMLEMDDGPEIVSHVSHKLGYAVSYDDCKKIAKVLKGHCDEKALLLAEMHKLGYKQVRPEEP